MEKIEKWGQILNFEKLKICSKTPIKSPNHNSFNFSFPHPVATMCSRFFFLSLFPFFSPRASPLFHATHCQSSFMPPRRWSATRAPPMESSAVKTPRPNCSPPVDIPFLSGEKCGSHRSVTSRAFS